jgi:hypothetical protein
MNWNAEILPQLPAKHRKALGYNVVGQGLAILLGAITLDGGVQGASTLIACIGYWTAVVIILVRRHSKMTSNDLIFFRFGFLVIWVVVLIVGRMAAFHLR